MRYRPEGLAGEPEVEESGEDGTPDGAARDGEARDGEAARASATAAPSAPASNTATATLTPTATATGDQLARWGAREWLRWMWRQLTSMRVALLLLLLLAVAALPGAFFPQRPQTPEKVAQYYLDHPDLAPVLERFGLFDVYASPWFAAVYLLLFVSLVGCIVPRAIDHVRTLREPPPRAPRRFSRFPVRDAFVTTSTRDDVVASATTALKPYRVRREEAGGVVTLSAERGYLREAGNITFHLALVGLLVSVAYGSLVHYRGQVIVVEGETFANSRIAYDSFDAGTWFAADSLDPFRMQLDSFTAEFDETTGAAKDFTASVTVTEPDGEPTAATIKVNHPLRVGGANVYLMGNGFAPRVQVRDASGALAFSGAVPFIPQNDATYESRGVIKVADTTTGTQIGLNGWLLPTAVVDADANAFSISPYPDDPALVLDVWSGDLGLDDGVPQNVYQLDTDGLTQVTQQTTADDGTETTEPVRVVVRPGETVDLPDGLGTITFEDLPRYVGLDLRYDPTLGFVLTFALLALGGLAGSLFLPRRRVFVRVGADDAGRTVVTAAALARGDDPGLDRELQRVLTPLRSGPGSGDAPPTQSPGSTA